MTIYTNLDGTTPDKGLGAILKWQIGDRIAGRRRISPNHFDTPRVENDGVALADSAASLTWIGHATFALRLAGKMIVTDPIWSDRISGAVARNAAPGVSLEKMPQIDVVTVSHSHRDHLDLPTLKKIGNQALFVVPKDVGEILKDAGLTRVIELGWWETHREGDLAITLVPAQHWSMRVPWDRNKRLWGGFVYESSRAGEGTAYHAGDTAFSELVFAAIFEHFPKIDWAMIPIGAYDPQWFMQQQHMNPEEAVRTFQLLRAKNLVAMHWGTFKLTDEPLDEPPQRVRVAFAKTEIDSSRLWIFDLGETRALRDDVPRGVPGRGPVDR